jgi:hypothetical protein
MLGTEEHRPRSTFFDNGSHNAEFAEFVGLPEMATF